MYRERRRLFLPVINHHLCQMLEMVEPPPEGECSSELAFQETPEDYSPVQDDLVQQSCTTNSPQADITWYKDGVRLMTGLFPTLSVQNKRLIKI